MEKLREKILEDKEFIEAFKKRERLEKELKSASADVYNRLEAAGIWIGNWKCDNPIGLCVYDWDDGIGDNCLFCHEPDERK